MNKKEIIKQGVDLFNKHFPNDKHTTQKEKKAVVKFFVELFKVTNGDKPLINRTIKVLQSKVKTYEADINNAYDQYKNNYCFNENCFCDKCKKHRESPEAISLIQQSINNTKQ